MVQTDASSNDNMEKLAKEAQQLISEKETKKKNIGNSVIVVLMKRESSGLNQVMTQSYQRL